MTLKQLAIKLSCVGGIDSAFVNEGDSIDVEYHKGAIEPDMTVGPTLGMFPTIEMWPCKWQCTILSDGTIEWNCADKLDFPVLALKLIQEYKFHNMNFKENNNMSDNDINAKIKKDVKQLAKDLNDKKRYDQNTSTAKRILHNLESEYGLSFKSKKSKNKFRKNN